MAAALLSCVLVNRLLPKRFHINDEKLARQTPALVSALIADDWTVELARKNAQKFKGIAAPWDDPRHRACS
jgi:hypothetical protein